MLTVLALGIVLGAPACTPPPATAPWWVPQGPASIYKVPATGHQPIVKVNGNSYPPSMGYLEWTTGSKTFTVATANAPTGKTVYTVILPGSPFTFTNGKETVTQVQITAETPSMDLVGSVSGSNGYYNMVFSCTDGITLRATVPVHLDTPYRS